MVAAVAGVAAVGGSLISANAAGDAADTQAAASQQAAAMQQAQYENNVKLQMPTIQTGNAARDRLSFLLGLSGTGFSNGVGSTGGQYSSTQPLTYDQLKQQLVGQYTKTNTATNAQPSSVWGPNAAYNGLTGLTTTIPGNAESDGATLFNANNLYTNSGASDGLRQPEGAGASSTIDEAGLDAEIRRRLAEQEAQQAAREAAARADPEFGKLAKDFQFNTYTPEKFDFTTEDFYANKDPGYEWRLQQGQKALDRSGAAAGRFLSGRQLQAASDYNQGAASQEFGNSYQRALSKFGTNEGNRAQAFNTNEGNRFNAYQANFNNAVNPLLSLAGAATLGSQNLGNAGAASATAQGNILTSQANATGAAGISTANSISSGLNNAVSGYQSNQLMNNLLNRNGNVNNNPISDQIDSLGASTNMWGTR